MRAAPSLLLPYPTVGKIAITNSGERIAVWPPEDNDEGCFSGQLLERGASLAKAWTFNLSVFWKIVAIAAIEEPTAADLELSLIELEILNPQLVEPA